MISRRLVRLRNDIKFNTQRIRSKTLKSLEEIFDLAACLAKGEFKTQTVDGKTVKVTMKQRQIWARVAAYTAQIMNSIAQGFDEKEIDMQLDELERIIHEAKAKTKNGSAENGSAKAETDKAADG